MKRTLFWIPVLLVLASALVALAGDGDLLFISEDDAEAFDLSELRDGETRVFGSGDRQLTATRKGDTVALERGAAGDSKALSIDCELGKDVCTVLTHGDDERVMVKIERKVECVSGSDDCLHGVDVVALGEGHRGKANVWVQKVGVAGCEDDDKDCADKEITVTVDAVDGALGQKMVFIGEDGGQPHVMHLDEHANVMRFADDGKVVLSCPEGDSKIHVEKEEAEDTFLCPKHNIPMEQTEAAIHKILIERTVVDDED